MMTVVMVIMMMVETRTTGVREHEARMKREGAWVCVCVGIYRSAEQLAKDKANHVNVRDNFGGEST